MIRLFAALAIPYDIADELTARQAGIRGARWRPVEAFHITLRFFGDVTEPIADDIESELAAITVRPLTLTLKGAGSFGDGPDLDAVWAGVEANEGLSRLAGRCETAARRAGLKAETRSYLPHVTLAYLRRADPADVAAWVQGHNLMKSPPFEVSSFGLYSSWQTDEGSVYRLERRYGR